LVIAVVAAVLVVGGALLVPHLVAGDDDETDGRPATVDPTGSVDTSNLALVQEYDVPPYTHVDDGIDVTYPQTPPVGGDHWNAWLECGAYGGVVPDEYAVHDLEHGSVWITYRPDEVDADGIDELASVLPQNGIMSPYPTQEAPVVLTVWGRQLSVLGPDDPRIKLFLDQYAGGATSPEYFSSCAGGITAPPG
jgi:hypothetical protein